MFESASWLNRPAQFEVSEDKLTIWTDEKTDFWRASSFCKNRTRTMNRASSILG